MRHFTWEEFQEGYIKPGVGGTYSPTGVPEVQIYSGLNGDRIGILVAIDDPETIAPIPLKQASVEIKMQGRQCFADFYTSNPALFEQFYSLMHQIADSVQLTGASPATAIEISIEKLKSLISSESLLPENEIVGLWGELWVLNRMILKNGATAVQYWKGSEGAVHDFQCKDVELEVKSTRNEERKHIIGRLSQLDPSPNCELFICSIQLELSKDKGHTLPEMISTIQQRLSDDQILFKEFNEKLKKAKYRNEDACYYSSRYYLRTLPFLVPVKEGFPRINYALLKNAFTSEAANRIDNVEYQLDVSGLGFGPDDGRYLELLGEEDQK